MASTTERPVYVYILGLTALILFGANMAAMLERELHIEIGPANPVSVEAPISVETPAPPQTPAPIVIDVEKIRTEVERVQTEVERIRVEQTVQTRRIAPRIVLFR